MKMNSIKVYIGLMLLGFFIGACEMLEPGLDNQDGYDRILKDPAFCEGLLSDAHMRLPTAYSFNEVATDDAVSNENANVYRRMATGEWSSQFNPFNSTDQGWAPSYASIYNINYFLTVVDKTQWSHLSEVRNNYFKKRFKGEAYALRGYFYSQLLTNYGGIATNGNLLGVPLITKALVMSDNWKIPRSTYQECFDQIISDYDSAISLLPYKWADIPDSVDYNKVFGSQNINRISGESVRALKVRITLHAASPAFNGGNNYDQTKCESAANLAGQMIVEKGGIAGLPPDGVVFYDADNDITNPDILWRNNYANSNTLERDNYPPTLYGYGRINPTQNLVEAFPDKDGYPISQSTIYNENDPYQNRDPRLKKYILTNGATLRSTVINTSADSPTNDGLNKLPERSTRTGYYLLKFLRVNVNMNPSGTTTARHFYTHVRWTELYLAYAEAANEAWGPDNGGTFPFTARDVIAAIRQRAGITQPDNYLASITSKADMRELIRNERRLELCFEGFRFWDLRRWNSDLTETARGVSIIGGVYDDALEVESRVYSSDAVYGPIPLNDILKYPGLLQNKGW